jgi:aminoglycoside phosphotransferase (APT) family kinase protein
MMHDDEIHSDDELVRHLLREQQPDLASQPIIRITSTGTSNAIYRIGNELAARLPLRPTKYSQFADEHRWLPTLATHLPLQIPVPIAHGIPTTTFPHHWSLVPWLAGHDAIEEQHDVDLVSVAQDLAEFIIALRAIDPTGGPFRQRGVHLAVRDRYTRDAIVSASHLINTEAITQLWQRALDAQPWDQPSVWLHADLASGNLLFTDDGRLSAVIDWGMMSVGDPACDVAVAWEMFDKPTRKVFRQALNIDDATWERSKGWALSTAIVALPYYEHTNRFMADQALRKLDTLLTDG